MSASQPTNAPPDEGAEYWEGARQGVLKIKRCVDTGKFFHYPRLYSPFTGGPTEWVTASGKGEVYSCSVSPKANPPYCVAYVRLDEGPMILTNVLDDDLSSIAIGQKVEVTFRDLNGKATPFFVRVR